MTRSSNSKKKNQRIDLKKKKQRSKVEEELEERRTEEEEESEEKADVCYLREYYVNGHEELNAHGIPFALHKGEGEQFMWSLYNFEAFMKMAAIKQIVSQCIRIEGCEVRIVVKIDSGLFGVKFESDSPNLVWVKFSFSIMDQVGTSSISLISEYRSKDEQDLWIMEEAELLDPKRGFLFEDRLAFHFRILEYEVKKFENEVGCSREPEELLESENELKIDLTMRLDVERLTKENDDLSKRVQILENQLEFSKSEQTQLNNKLMEVTKEKDVYKDRFCDLERECSNMKLNSNELKTQTEKLKKMREDHARVSQSLKDQKRMSKERADQLTQQVATVEASESKLKIERDNIAKEKKNLARRVQELENQLASKEKRFTSFVHSTSSALSRYTEMVNDIIKKQVEKLQQGSELVQVRLKELDLPNSIIALEGNFTLPTTLKEDVEVVRISGGPAELEVELQEVRDLSRVVNRELLVATEEILQKEATEDAQFRSQFGMRCSLQSSTLTNRFSANLRQVVDSDALTECSVGDHSALMSILDRHPIESALPMLARPRMSLNPREVTTVESLKQSLRQLETLGARREELEDKLKEMKRKDDILPKLMASTGSYEDLLNNEIMKYDDISTQIAQNIEEQEQLLLQIQVQNDVIFNLEDNKASREKSYKQIEAATAKDQEIQENVNEGLKFPGTLQDAGKIIQCREVIDDLHRTMISIGFQDNNPAGAYNYPSVGQPHHQIPRSNSQQQINRAIMAQPSHPQTSYYIQHPEQPTMTRGYAHHSSPYVTTPQLQPPHYDAVALGGGPPYPSLPQPQQQPPVSHEYGQLAYPGWRGPYYTLSWVAQQPGTLPPAFYTIPSPYPPHFQ